MDAKRLDNIIIPIKLYSELLSKWDLIKKREYQELDPDVVDICKFINQIPGLLTVKSSEGYIDNTKPNIVNCPYIDVVCTDKEGLINVHYLLNEVYDLLREKGFKEFSFFKMITKKKLYKTKKYNVLYTKMIFIYSLRSVSCFNNNKRLFLSAMYEAAKRVSDIYSK